PEDGEDGPDPGGYGAPPSARIKLSASCTEGLCRVLTGEQVRFEDASSGAVRSRLWELGDGRTSRRSTLDHAWVEPGFYVVTLRVSDGPTESTDSRVFLVEALAPAGNCKADGETLCLRDSRYRVRTSWRSGDGRTGTGAVVRQGTNDSGLFWFFDRENWEVLVKVLDGCTMNGAVWVFAASTTNLGYVIEVTDTATGAVREYRNDPGMPAPAITDANAFPGSCRPRRESTR
ncbi:MAG: PKD domain-containing protein, partial [Holophagales bacterium]|nr:PKD domain-containing protein [Holophagales bacterium]